jgi:hypothetical protein
MVRSSWFRNDVKLQSANNGEIFPGGRGFGFLVLQWVPSSCLSTVSISNLPGTRYLVPVSTSTPWYTQSSDINSIESVTYHGSRMSVAAARKKQGQTVSPPVRFRYSTSSAVRSCQSDPISRAPARPVRFCLSVRSHQLLVVLRPMHVTERESDLVCPISSILVLQWSESDHWTPIANSVLVLLSFVWTVGRYKNKSVVL